VLTRIILKEDLAEKFCAELTFDITCPLDAINAIECNYPGFRAYLMQQSREGFMYQVTAGDDWDLTEEDLALPIGDRPLTITPVMVGEGKIGSLIAGGVLLGLGLTGVGVIFSAATTALIGGTLALQGLKGLFASPKVPDSNEKKEANKSIIQNGATNISSSGGRMQIAFGRDIFIGSQVVSALITTVYKELDEEDDSN
jgi:predicted phage tail protein